MDRNEAAALLGQAIADTGQTLTRLPGREARSGVHEVGELGPALRDSLLRLSRAGRRVALNESLDMTNWNRRTSQVDLVLYEPARVPRLVAELKAWDIGHQLFDLAKICCLLATGVPAGFLVCVAKRESDFDRMPGGELFAAIAGEPRQHRFDDLIARHRSEWQSHVGRGGPEPTSVPSLVSTTTVAAGIELQAYPGHSIRAVEVAIRDSTPLMLDRGWPRHR